MCRVGLSASAELLVINDIDKGVVNKLLKFADDTKLVGIVSNDIEIEQLRSDLHKLYNWSVDWQMVFNTDKCKLFHFDNENVKSVYSLGDELIRAEQTRRKKIYGLLYISH